MGWRIQDTPEVVPTSDPTKRRAHIKRYYLTNEAISAAGEAGRDFVRRVKEWERKRAEGMAGTVAAAQPVILPDRLPKQPTSNRLARGHKYENRPAIATEREGQHSVCRLLPRRTADHVVPYFKRMNGHGWQSGSAAEPRPLFGLDVLAQADIARAVFIVEGEKVAAALQSLGLVAVTSQGGSKAAAKTDWKPLEGRGRAYLLPDNDAPGEAYAEAIALILRGFQKLTGVQIVRLPDLPDLPAGGDVVDWISARIPQWDGFEPVPESGADTAALLEDHVPG